MDMKGRHFAAEQTGVSEQETRRGQEPFFTDLVTDGSEMPTVGHPERFGDSPDKATRISRKMKRSRFPDTP